eukprot:scaffold227555_cov48-Attheya_sp.AAC.2
MSTATQTYGLRDRSTRHAGSVGNGGMVAVETYERRVYREDAGNKQFYLGRTRETTLIALDYLHSSASGRALLYCEVPLVLDGYFTVKEGSARRVVA